MYFFKQARREARALVVAALIGGGFGLAVGGAYLAGGLANAAADRVTVSGLITEARLGFSSQALNQRTTRMDPSALAIALRHDRLGITDELRQSRQGLMLVNRLESSEAAQDVRAAIDAVGPSAEPFAQASALQSSRDLDCLTTAVYFEARGESAAGQAAVAQVVLNRVRHPAYPRTICGVVFQGAQGRGCQFSFACNGAMRRPRDPAAWSRARDVALRAMSGFVMTAIGNATNFHSVNVSPGWSNMVRVRQVGSHIFYRFAGRNGASEAFTARPLPSGGDAQVAAAAPPAPPEVIEPLAPVSPTHGEPLAPMAPQSPQSETLTPASFQAASSGPSNS